MSVLEACSGSGRGSRGNTSGRVRGDPHTGKCHNAGKPDLGERMTSLGNHSPSGRLAARLPVLGVMLCGTLSINLNLKVGVEVVLC